MTIPLWREVLAKHESGAVLDPVERFVLDHWQYERKGADDPWRRQLGELVEFVAARGAKGTDARPGSVVSVAPGLATVMVRLESGVTDGLVPGMRVTVAEAQDTGAAG